MTLLKILMFLVDFRNLKERLLVICNGMDIFTGCIMLNNVICVISQDFLKFYLDVKFSKFM